MATNPSPVESPEQKCPVCGADGVEFVYGLPSDEMQSAARAGLIVLGGWWTEDGSPAYRCAEPGCGNEWGTLT